MTLISASINQNTRTLLVEVQVDKQWKARSWHVRRRKFQERQRTAASHQSWHAAAQELQEDNRAQVELGTQAPLELTRAQSLVTSSQLDLIQAEGLVNQQEIILKTQLARQGASDPVLANLHIAPTDPIRVPPTDDLPSGDVLVSQALSMRPDLAQASLQVESSQAALKGSQNATRPEIDLSRELPDSGQQRSTVWLTRNARHRSDHRAVRFERGRTSAIEDLSGWRSVQSAAEKPRCSSRCCPRSSGGPASTSEEAAVVERDSRAGAKRGDCFADCKICFECGRAKVEKGDQLYAIETPNGILLTLYDPEVQEQMEIGDKLLDKHRDVFKALAK